MSVYPKLQEDKLVTQEFLMAIGAYKNKAALKILNDIAVYAFNKKDNDLLSQLQLKVVANNALIYESFLIQLWEKYGVIDKSTFQNFKTKKELNLSNFIRNGLLNEVETYIFTDEDYRYFDNHLLKEMLELLEKAGGSNQLIPIINHNIKKLNSTELSIFTNFIKRLKPSSSAEILLEKLKTTQQAYLLFAITEAILSYQNTNYNQQLLTILEQNRTWIGVIGHLLLEIN